MSSEFPRETQSATSTISSKNLLTLVRDLGMGLPIPSIENPSDNSQRASSPSEILLAGWVHRCTTFKDEFINSYLDWASSQSNCNIILNELKAKVNRADESLKRSLQVAEWFNILDKSAKQSHMDPNLMDPSLEIQVLNSLAIESNGQSHKLSGLLSDIQIRESINSGELRVVPLIDSERQISGSVMDLRLGHNFEIFFSNIQGAIDPLMMVQGPESDSTEVDVDFLNSISIGPGQFLLGHTLEYIKLPDDVAAQIEGRSSFARLGLQVHMTANLVEAGFDGCLTLEITNCGASTIILYPGMRIAQLRFFRLTSKPARPYNSFRNNKYRGMLSHNKTQQFSDWEVRAFKEAKERLKTRIAGLSEVENEN
jgi:dCTP deaminase